MFYPSINTLTTPPHPHNFKNIYIFRFFFKCKDTFQIVLSSNAAGTFDGVTSDYTISNSNLGILL